MRCVDGWFEAKSRSKRDPGPRNHGDGPQRRGRRAVGRSLEQPVSAFHRTDVLVHFVHLHVQTQYIEPSPGSSNVADRVVRGLEGHTCVRHGCSSLKGVGHPARRSAHLRAFQ